ncbi:MAG: hypothetical protein C0423_03195 [Methylibium sp.]|nr:hypothetical protein [Methylibium sp.]
MIKLLGSAGLAVATLSALLLFSIAATTTGSRDGGRLLAAVLTGLPLLGGLLLAYGCGLGNAGFDWVLGERGTPTTRWLLVLAALLAAAVVATLSAAVRTETPGSTPWALWPVRDWAHWVWLPALLAGAALGLYPTLRQGLPWWAWQAPLGALAGLSLLLCAGLLVQLVQAQQETQAQQLQDELNYVDRRNTMMLEKVQQADPERDLLSLLPHTSPYEQAEIREPALAKLRQLPDLDAALIQVLQGAYPGEAFAYLQTHEVKNPAALAEAIRHGIEAYATQLKDGISRTHTLRADDYQPAVQRILATVDRYAAQGVDYRPALRQLRDSFDAPRTDYVQPTPAMAGQRDIDNWLNKH